MGEKLDLKKESVERGGNVLVDIELIRHPEKSYETGNLTEAGKVKLEQKLQDAWDSDSYDTHKIYGSPLKRGQQSLDIAKDYLTTNNIPTRIRTRDALVGKVNEVGKNFDSEMSRIVDLEKITTSEKNEPISKETETIVNEVLIRDFFDKKWPDSPFSGEEHGKVLEDFIRHFSEMAKRLKNGSRVKLTLISHSGVIEYLTKLVYLRNNPDLRSGDVTAETIGGLVDYMDGPKIHIQSDAKGAQKIIFAYKDMRLDFKV